MSTYIREDNDMSIVLFSEEGEGGFDEVYLAEEDDFELIADEVLCCC